MLIQTIMGMFPNLNSSQVETYAIGLFNSVDDWKNFKGTIRDLMISMRSFSNQQDAFYEHERQQELEKAKTREQEKKMAIPGMNKTP